MIKKLFLISIIFFSIFINYFYLSYKLEKSYLNLSKDEIDKMDYYELKGYVSVKEKISKENLFLDIFFIVFNILSGILIGYLIFNKDTKKILDTEEFLKLLPEREKEIFSLILKNGGKITQYEIWKKLNMNKVMVSRLVKKLENEGKIIVHRDGKVNYIELSEDLKKLFLNY